MTVYDRNREIHPGGFFEQGQGHDPFRREDPNKGQQATILESLTPGVSYKVEHTPLSQHNVQTGNNAEGRVTQGRDAVNNVQQDVKASKEMIRDTIRDAQKEVCAMAKSLGHNPGDLFGDNRIAGGGEFGLAIQAAAGTPLFKGMGSIVTAGVKHGPDASLVAQDMKSGPANREAIMAEIQAKLIEASRPVDTRAGAAPIMFASDDGKELKQSQFNWEEYFKNNKEDPLGKLMAIDPEDDMSLSQHIPEFAELDDIDNEANQVLDNLEIVEDRLEVDPTLDQNSLTMRSAAEIYFQTSSLRDLNGAKADKKDVKAFEDEEKIREKIAALYALEMDPRKLGLDSSGPSFAAAM